jgi:hypothetical protein
MKRSTIIAMMAISMFSCNKKNTQPANTGSVLFVNGCAGTLPGIDAQVNDVNVSGALNMPFTTYSGYRYVSSGTAVKVAYYITNTGTPVVSNNVTIADGQYYTAFAGGLVTNPALVFVQDDQTMPAADKAKVRFVNLCRDALSITATVANTTIGTGVTSLGVTPYIEVKADNYELKAGDPGNINTVVSTGNKTLAAGRSYTIMLTGSTAGTGESGLKLTLVNNN